MTTSVTLEAYAGRGLEIDFKCFADDGTTPLDLTGGVASFSLTRGGVSPFSLETSTSVPGAYEWTDQAQGTGKFFFSDDDMDLPVGYCRYRLVSVTADGTEDLQALGWMRLRSS